MSTLLDSEETNVGQQCNKKRGANLLADAGKMINGWLVVGKVIGLIGTGHRCGCYWMSAGSSVWSLDCGLV